MSKNFETGHAKNVANLDDLIVICKSYGVTYNPSKASLKLPALDNLLLTSQNAINNVTDKLIAFDDATNNRQNLFAGLKRLSTRIVSALKATDAPDNKIADAISANRKIQGTRAEKKKKISANPATNLADEQHTISVSRQSYDMLIEHFNKLIGVVSTELSYQPNEPDLSVNGLTSLLANMRNANHLIGVAYADIALARIQRDEIIYDKDLCLTKTAANVKSYIKSNFGASSTQYRTVSKIKFRAKS